MVLVKTDVKEMYLKNQMVVFIIMELLINELLVDIVLILKNGEAVVFEKGGFVGNLGLSKKLWKKYIEVSYKYRTNTDKMTASDYTHLFGYLNPYYRSAYNIPKRRK